MNARLALVAWTAMAGASAQAHEAETLETVTVHGTKEHTTTGAKLGLSIRETPASIEVIDAETMAQRGDSTVLRAVTKAAGIVGGASGHGTAGNYSVRGFTGYPGIDFLHDGIKLNGTIFSKRTLDVASLDRIEIVRGASSVLNGEGSVGATVNLVSKKPSLRREETELGFKAGSHGSYRLDVGRAGVIIEDRLAFRVDAVARRIGTNYAGEKRELHSLSAALLYQFSGDLQTTMSFEKSQDDGEHDYQGTPLVNGKLDRSVQDINYNNLVDGIDSGNSVWLKHGIAWQATPNIELKNQLYYQNAGADIRRLYLAVQDTANPAMVNRRGYESRQKQRLLGNRLDVIGRADVFGFANKVLLGLDASRLALSRQQSTYAGRILPTPMHAPAALHYRDFFNTTVDDYRKPDADITLHQVALYVEDQLRLTEDLALVAGLRHDRYDIEYNFRKGLSSPTDQTIDKKHRKLSYRAGLVFDVTPTANLYVSCSSSFEPGDASASFLTVSAAQTKLDLTKARQYEAGMKRSFMEGRADLAASAYVITKKNMFVNNPTPGTGLLNVGKQTARGVELTVGVRPNDRWQIDANLSRVHSTYDDFVHNGIDYAGRTPSSIPKHVANLGVRYMPTRELGIGSWVRNVGSMYTDNIGFANSVKLPRYTTVDLTVDYAISDALTASMLLKNLTDELYATTARRDAQVFLGEARGVEFSVNYRF